MDEKTESLLALIRKHESDGAVRRQGVSSSYDVRLMGSVAPPKPLTEMTVNEVLAFQQEMIRGGAESGAVGAYQIIPKTLRSLVNKMGLNGNERFDKSLQDSMATDLLNRRGYASFRDGTISRERFANNLAAEWASLPLVTGPNAGRSRYAGVGSNRASARPEDVLAALDGAAPGNAATPRPARDPLDRPDPTGPRANNPIPLPRRDDPGELADPMRGLGEMVSLQASLQTTRSPARQPIWRRIWAWAVTPHR